MERVLVEAVWGVLLGQFWVTCFSSGTSYLLGMEFGTVGGGAGWFGLGTGELGFVILKWRLCELFDLHTLVMRIGSLIGGYLYAVCVMWLSERVQCCDTTC